MAEERRAPASFRLNDGRTVETAWLDGEDQKGVAVELVGGKMVPESGVWLLNVPSPNVFSDRGRADGQGVVQSFRTQPGHVSVKLPFDAGAAFGNRGRVGSGFVRFDVEGDEKTKTGAGLAFVPGGTAKDGRHHVRLCSLKDLSPDADGKEPGFDVWETGYRKNGWVRVSYRQFVESYDDSESRGWRKDNGRRTEEIRHGDRLDRGAACVLRDMTEDAVSDAFTFDGRAMRMVLMPDPEDPDNALAVLVDDACVSRNGDGLYDVFVGYGHDYVAAFDGSMIRDVRLDSVVTTANGVPESVTADDRYSEAVAKALYAKDGGEHVWLPADRFRVKDAAAGREDGQFECEAGGMTFRAAVFGTDPETGELTGVLVGRRWDRLPMEGPRKKRLDWRAQDMASYLDVLGKSDPDKIAPARTYRARPGDADRPFSLMGVDGKWVHRIGADGEGRSKYVVSVADPTAPDGRLSFTVPEEAVQASIVDGRAVYGVDLGKGGTVLCTKGLDGKPVTAAEIAYKYDPGRQESEAWHDVRLCDEGYLDGIPVDRLWAAKPGGGLDGKVCVPVPDIDSDDGFGYLLVEPSRLRFQDGKLGVDLGEVSVGMGNVRIDVPVYKRVRDGQMVDVEMNVYDLCRNVERSAGTKVVPGVSVSMDVAPDTVRDMDVRAGTGRAMIVIEDLSRDVNFEMGATGKPRAPAVRREPRGRRPHYRVSSDGVCVLDDVPKAYLAEDRRDGTVRLRIPDMRADATGYAVAEVSGARVDYRPDGKLSVVLGRKDGEARSYRYDTVEYGGRVTHDAGRVGILQLCEIYDRNYGKVESLSKSFANVPDTGGRFVRYEVDGPAGPVPMVDMRLRDGSSADGYGYLRMRESDIVQTGRDEAGHDLYRVPLGAPWRKVQNYYVLDGADGGCRQSVRTVGKLLELGQEDVYRTNAERSRAEAEAREKRSAAVEAHGPEERDMTALLSERLAGTGFDERKLPYGAAVVSKPVRGPAADQGNTRIRDVPLSDIYVVHDDRLGTGGDQLAVMVRGAGRDMEVRLTTAGGRTDVWFEESADSPGCVDIGLADGPFGQKRLSLIDRETGNRRNMTCNNRFISERAAELQAELALTAEKEAGPAGRPLPDISGVAGGAGPGSGPKGPGE